MLAKKMLCLSTHISTILTEFPVSSCIYVADKLLAYGKIELKVLKTYSSSLKEECCKSINLLFLENFYTLIHLFLRKTKCIIIMFMNPCTKIEIYVSGVQAVGWANMAIYQVKIYSILENPNPLLP